MKRVLVATVVLAAAAAATSCTHDYDQFQAGAVGGGTSYASAGGTGGTSSGGTGGSAATGGTGGTGGSSGSGGTSTGGTGGTGTGGTGTGGTDTGGSAGTGTGGVAGSGTGGMAGSGTGGTAGSAGSGTGGSAGAGGCSVTQKLCGSQCVALDDPQTGCAAVSCDPCVVDHATAACVGGACDIGSCASDFGNCNNDATDGCEVELASATTDCGACSRACSAAHVQTPSCVGGLCLSSCDAGWGNCVTPQNGPDDGCETNLDSSAGHCGSCANACPSGFVCSSGLCACDSNTDCRSSPSVNATCDTGHCVCDAACVPGETCVKSGSASSCSCNGGTACAATETCCQTPAGCKSLQVDPNNCGACGHACAAGQQCNGGACI